MADVTTFDSTKELLHNLLLEIKHRKLQLPDFQRGWVWDDDRISSLLASVSQSYPIGAVMLLQTGGAGVRFRPRPVQGVEIDPPCGPERLILDGQQRLTALYQALQLGAAVETRDPRGARIRRWYYIDLAKALDEGDRDEAIVSISEDRISKDFRGQVRADYSTQELECAAEMMPLSLVFDIAGLTNWQLTYISTPGTDPAERLRRWNRVVESVIQPFQQYQIPVIVMGKATPKEAVCQVFEKVNTGGVSLTVFELLTATFAADDFLLRKDWEARRAQLSRDRILAGVENTDVLQIVTLLATQARQAGIRPLAASDGGTSAISCKRKDILKLSLEEYQRWADPAIDGLERAARLLHSQKVFNARDLPYKSQLVPLASIMASLGQKGESDGVRQKLLQWYWCGVFGELYGGATETRFARDLPEVIAWVLGEGPEPSTISEALFRSNRLMTMRTRNSAAYKGLHALLMRDGGLDFRTGSPIDVSTYFDERLDIHHIFPQSWCIKNGIPAGMRDSIVNKTPLDARTNRIISGYAPSVYVPRLQRSAGIDDSRMEVILNSHVIDPNLLKADDFHGFFAVRMGALLDRIESAMGRPVDRTASAEVEQADTSEDENEEEVASSST